MANELVNDPSLVREDGVAGWAAPSGGSVMVMAGRPCSWCAVPFMAPWRPGRPRLYCKDSCKQRAYEHRHGFLRTRTVVALPGQLRGDTWRGSGYERGGWAVRDRRSHALRTSVRPDGSRRETLCGLLVVPLAGQHFTPLAAHACATCTDIAAKHPLELGISHSNELSTIRAMIDEVAEHRLTADQALRWLRERQPPPTPRTQVA